jgi:signal transduction histidine kinase
MRRPLIQLLLLFLFNTAIAVMLTLIDFGGGFWINFVFSQCIGGAIALVNLPLIPRLPPGWRRALTLAVTLPAGVLLGVVLAHLLLGMPLNLSRPVWQGVAVGLMFGVVGSVMFLLAEQVHRQDDALRQGRLAAAEQARREAEAHLRLLQAQIEPHFLFNTLANLASLIETDPARARSLLERLNDWLRAALARSRGERGRLGDELDLLENWLEIMALRFGPRLCWSVAADPDARAWPLPPMLLQPLVENAVKHGIEPLVGGGQLRIRAALAEGRLRVEVEDNGPGLDLTRPAASGAGLDNVRARLAALYGDAARLDLRAAPDGGVIARLDLPCAS